jgi:pyruvate/2-oxoglutarate dehydrogenase complex dihydrolipoamide acyltransferase (E2) component
MIRIRHIAALAALCSLPVLCLAQAQKPAAEKPATPMKAEANQEKMAAAPAPRHLTAKSREDARECLSFPTNREVIICAEKYL